MGEADVVAGQRDLVRDLLNFIRRLFGSGLSCPPIATVGRPVLVSLYVIGVGLASIAWPSIC